MIKFILILLALIVIAVISVSAYTAPVRRDIYKCTNDAKLKLVRIQYRLDPDDEQCQIGYNIIKELNACTKKVYDKYDFERTDAYDMTIKYLGNMLEGPEDMKSIHNNTCSKKFPETIIK